MAGTTVVTTNLPLPLFGRGKVRDTYDLDDHLLMVATDRLSAFDCILPNGIPGKGEVLTRMSAFWFRQTQHIVDNHLVSTNISDLPSSLATYGDVLDSRFMLVRKAQRIDYECVVRGYLAGSAWKEYRDSGAVCGIELPAGLRQSEPLPQPLFTPATKADSGHDVNVSLDHMKNAIGEDLGQALAECAIAVYQFAAQFALDHGIIIADTKMEFGLLDGRIILIDELLTPDSSRFWAAGTYEVGGSPPSFDKQFVRDWLESSGWDKKAPAPRIPQDVLQKTADKYHEALLRLTAR